VLNPETQLRADEFLGGVTRARRSLLMLDYDGTLSPFREKRDQAFPYPGMVQLLRDIMASGRTRVVIISGRDAIETATLLGMDSAPEIWGFHGLQRRKTDGTLVTITIPENDRRALLAADQWIREQQLRQAVEVKTGSIAVHWRGLDERGVYALRSRVLAGWIPLVEQSRLELLDFDGGVEIRARAINKGDVVRLLLGEIEKDAPAAYLGDDTTDESAFQAIAGRGLSVLVRPRWRRTAAQLWMRPPRELLEFLAQWRIAVYANSRREEPVPAGGGR